MTSDSTLQILIKATDMSSGVLTGVGGRISALSDGARDVSQPFADLATSVAKLDAALVALVGGGLALAVAESGKFSGAFAEITTLFDAPTASVNTFRQDILDFARDSKSGIDEINGAVYSAISAGADYTESLGLVGQAEQTAIAGKAGLNAATVLLASSLNAYGSSMDQAASYSDALFVAVRDGQTTLPELAASLAQVTGVAAQSGVSFDELLAAVATLTASGLPTSQAVTSIKGALTNILKPSKDAEETAKKLGLQFNSAGLATKGFGGFMADLTTKAGGNIDAMSSLFGSIEGLNGALILTGTGAGKFSTVLEHMGDKAGATSTAYTKMADQMAQTNQNLANNTKVTLVAVGDQIMDDYTALIGALGDVFASLGEAVQNGSFDDLFTVIEAAFNKAQTALEGLAKNLPEALAGVDLSSLADSFGGMFDGIDLNSAEGVRLAIQSIVDSLESLVTFSRGVVDGLKPFIGLLMDAVEWFNGLDDSTKSAIAGLTGVMTAVNLLSGPLGTAGMAISAVGKALGGADGLSEKLDDLKLKTGGFLGKWAGPMGVAAIVTASAVAVGLAVKEFIGWRDAVGLAEQAEARAAGSAALLAEKYQAISDVTGVVITSTQDLREAVAAGTIYFDKATKSWAAGSGPVREFKEEVSKAADASYDWNEELKDLVDENGNLKGVVISATAAVSDQKQELIDYYIAAGNSPAVAKFMADAEATKMEAIKKTTKAVDDATQKTETYQLQMAKLASAERIKGMELTFDFNLDALKSEAEKAKAIIDTVGTGIESTGKLIGDLFGMLGSTTNFTDRWAMQDQIEEENKRRAGAFNQQKKLTEQQIEMNKQRIDRLKSGDALMKFEVGGLEPELEMIFWKIAEKMQVRVTEEASELLLGMGQ